MTDGMRRAPRLWEQKLEGMIRSAGLAGLGSASSAVIGPGPVPGPDAGGSEPSPPPVVDLDPATPRVPSTPIVAGTTLGLTITWDGKDSAGVLFPRGTTVQVHVSASTGFTPAPGTLKGVIAEAGGSLLVGGIAAGSTFYVRFVGVFPDGEESDPSAEGSAVVGLVQGPEINGDAVITQIVSATTPVTTFKLGSIWINTSNGTYNVLQDVAGTPTWVKREWDTAAIAANAISANQIAAQAITTKFLTGEIIRTGASPSARIEISATSGIEVFRDATNKTFWAKPSGEVVFGTTSVSSGGTTVINGDAISTGSISGDRITGGTISGTKIVTSGGGSRVRLADEVSGPWGTADAIEFFSGGTQSAMIHYVSGDGLDIYSNTVSFLNKAGDAAPGSVQAYVYGDLDVTRTLAAYVSATFGEVGVNAALRVSSGGDVFSYGIDAATTANAANVRIGASAKLLKSTSTVRFKDELVPTTDDLVGVDPTKIAEFPASIDPFDVLAITPTEFRSLSVADSEARMFGFIAEDVAEKLPWAANWDEGGLPSAVEDRPILAALLFVVREQQSAIADLQARVAALES
jgi:hypothetical protein